MRNHFGRKLPQESGLDMSLVNATPHEPQKRTQVRLAVAGELDLAQAEANLASARKAAAAEQASRLS